MAIGALADDALTAMGARARVMPVIVIHGDVDPSIPYRCGEQVIAQWLGADDVVLGRGHRRGVADPAGAVRDGAVAGGYRYTVRSYPDGSGCVVAAFFSRWGLSGPLGAC